jgi:tripartite-type tricarboxylate transporter receptor subunit TctC
MLALHRFIVSLSLTLVPCSLVQAQEYPSRTVKLVNFAAAGGVSDRMARALAKPMSTLLGQSVIVENRPGAAGSIAIGEVLKSKPDGYVIGQTCLSPILLPLAGEKLSFDFRDDAVIVGMMGGLDVILVTRSDSPIATVEQLIAAAKARPGELTVGMAQAPANIIPLVYLAQRAGVSLNLISYKSEVAALTDVIGGSIGFSLNSVGAVLPQLKAGSVKGVLLLTDQRNAALANVPALPETKVPGFAPNNYCVMFVPKGTPGAVISTLNRALNEAAKDPELRRVWDADGLVWNIGGTPAEASAFYFGIADRWRDVARDVDFGKYK